METQTSILARDIILLSILLDWSEDIGIQGKDSCTIYRKKRERNNEIKNVILMKLNNFFLFHSI